VVSRGICPGVGKACGGMDEVSLMLVWWDSCPLFWRVRKWALGTVSTKVQPLSFVSPPLQGVR
jgi:hypothetical protein